MKKIIILLTLLILPFLVSLGAVIFLIFSLFSGVKEQEQTNYDSVYASCSATGEIDMNKWNATWNDSSKVGVMKGYGDFVLKKSNELKVDPVFVTAILQHETGRGTSPAIRNHNNPAGVMDWDNNWRTIRHFSTLEQGLEFSIKNIARIIYEQGLVEIEEFAHGKLDANGNRIGGYAPLGAANDPTGSNKNWVPNVLFFANELGGLIMNCTHTAGTVEIQGDIAWVVPSTKRMTYGFGDRNCDGCSKKHKGLDITEGAGRSFGKPAVAFQDGTVTKVFTGCVEGNLKCGGGFGNHVKIQHANGIMTIYAHLSQPKVKVGQKVKIGQVVGLIGNTGNSYGAHLHFELHVNGEAVDPFPYFKEFNLPKPIYD